MYNYFFHKDNPKKHKEIEEEFKKLLQKDLYQKAMKEVKVEYLSTYQKIVLKNAVKGRVWALELLAVIKSIIKNMQGKKNK